MHQAALSMSSLCFSWSGSNNYELMKTAIKTLSWAHNEINAVFKPPQQFHRHTDRQTHISVLSQRLHLMCAHLF